MAEEQEQLDDQNESGGFLESLPPRLKAAAIRLSQSHNKSNLEDILELPRQELARLGVINPDEADRLQQQAAQHLFPASKMGKSMLEILSSHPPKRLSLSCPLLDTCLGGGLPEAGGIVEVCGESSSGKTQFCIQALLQAQLPIDFGGLDGAGLFISTKPDTGRRLEQLLGEWTKTYPESVSSDKFLISRVSDLDQLLQLLRQNFRLLIRAKRVKVVAIDSIASLFMGMYEQGELDQRAVALYELAREIKVLADDCRVTVLVVNHVSDFFGHSSDVKAQQATGGCWMSSGRAVIPQLGLFWAQCISSRLILTRTGRNTSITSIYQTQPTLDGMPAPKRRKLDSDESSEPVSVEIRELRVQFSSFCGSYIDTDAGKVGFYIDKAGLHGLHADQL